ncbi:MAG: SOS response-associated peptidase [Gemmatimonadaceae bacterium]|nr:SOS response-associated peptidase [Gloeobacterales cyanobacterium ES-bin-141]
MCGRYTLSASAEKLSQAFNLDTVPPLVPRFNIAPTQMVAAVREETQKRRLVTLRWGLIPAWAKDPAIGNKLINARAETLSEKPSFRSASRLRRCLIPVSGFYEWQRLEGRKQPHYIRLGSGEPFAFAGLWESWHGPEAESVESCTIITTTANTLVGTIHDRMPVILAPHDYDAWLNEKLQSPEAVLPLLRPYPAEAMEAHPVSTRVNKPGVDAPELVNSL